MRAELIHSWRFRGVKFGARGHRQKRHPLHTRPRGERWTLMLEPSVVCHRRRRLMRFLLIPPRPSSAHALPSSVRPSNGQVGSCAPGSVASAKMLGYQQIGAIANEWRALGKLGGARMATMNARHDTQRSSLTIAYATARSREVRAKTEERPPDPNDYRVGFFHVPAHRASAVPMPTSSIGTDQ